MSPEPVSLCLSPRQFLSCARDGERDLEARGPVLSFSEDGKSRVRAPDFSDDECPLMRFAGDRGEPVRDAG